jgi:hypothetical protein
MKLVAAEANDIAIHHFAPAAGFGLPIHGDLPVSNEEFRLPAGAGHAFKFKNFIELYWFFQYVDRIHALLQ